MSHHTAPLDVRERLSTAAEASSLLEAAHAHFGGAVLLSTCNRLELYVAGEHSSGALAELLAEELATSRQTIAGAFEEAHGVEAFAHLGRVAAGLDSMVLGESEILGQVRGAFGASVAAGAADAVLSHAFHSAIRVGRKARAETAIAVGATSISSIAAREARSHLGDLGRATALVIGAGEAGRLAAEALADSGVGRLLIANRTPERARELASALASRIASVEAVPWAGLREALAASDVAIAAAGADEPLVTLHAARAAAARRDGPAWLLLDIAVPRAVDPAVRRLPGVRYLDLEDLQATADRSSELRRREVAAVEALVSAATVDFESWCARRATAPTIRDLASRAERLRLRQLERALRGHGLETLGEAERAQILGVVDGLSKALVKQLLHDPIRAVRGGGTPEADAARRLFRLDEPFRLDEAADDNEA